MYQTFYIRLKTINKRIHKIECIPSTAARMTETANLILNAFVLFEHEGPKICFKISFKSWILSGWISRQNFYYPPCFYQQNRPFILLFFDRYRSPFYRWSRDCL